MCQHHMKLANNVLHLIFPGQIELFTHVPVLCNFVEHLKQKNFNVCVVYLLDSQICMRYETESVKLEPDSACFCGFSSLLM
jgi:hypothetical protein